MITRTFATSCATLLLSLAVAAAWAQSPPPAAPDSAAPISAAAPQAQAQATPLAPDALPAEDAPPRALEPFVASYEVFNSGRRLGTATMQAVPVEQAQTGSKRWRIDLHLKGGGLMRLTGLNLQQSTLFENVDNQYRPLSQALVKRVFLSNRKTVGVYDWAARSAHWTGDVKKTRRRPVPLQPGDMSGLLINLAVIRDAQPGATLNYRFVDDGRVRDHVYQVAPQTELVQVGELSYDAMRVERIQQAASGSAGEQTVIWVAAGVPTPIRILQREDGQDATDLRLIEYH
ncbi:MAG TPA: DUF3108 domain-containing protein [Xanthomonadaceae bacterium]|nr:DUF3108 domain-containing protein [Xanthomonadaceae bacterium]